VATGLGFRTGDTIGVYDRPRGCPAPGLGAAMTERIAADGAADGCMVAVIQSSPMGQQVYERLGYRMVVEYNGWIDSAPDRE
jgi:hypothetical protein